MAKLYPFRIITPEETLYDGQIESLVAPGALGSLGVLANHAPLLTSLTDGKIKVLDRNGDTHFFHVQEGILEVSPKETVVLTEGARRV